MQETLETGMRHVSFIEVPSTKLEKCPVKC